MTTSQSQMTRIPMRLLVVFIIVSYLLGWYMNDDTSNAVNPATVYLMTGGGIILLSILLYTVNNIYLFSLRYQFYLWRAQDRNDENEQVMEYDDWRSMIVSNKYTLRKVLVGNKRGVRIFTFWRYPMWNLTATGAFVRFMVDFIKESIREIQNRDKGKSR